MSNKLLVDLAQEVKALAESPEQLTRRKLWADLLNLRPVRPLVNYYMYASVWAREIAPGTVQHASGLEANIELQLRSRLWKARHYPDDTPLLPTVWVAAAWPTHDETFPWGVPMRLESPTAAGGAYRPIPPIRTEEDLARLRAPRYAEDPAATQRKIAEASELIGGVLPVKARSDELHWGPFEYAVRLRGMDNLLLDFYDRPEFVHRLMRTITDGMIGYQKEREAAGAVDAEAAFCGHYPYDENSGTRSMLNGCWAYVHAQSSASLSPRMYGEFIQPYNERIAALVGKVYYHGCEDLSQKCRIIKSLPGLRLFHISPWTPPEPVVECLGSGFVYEVHSHPTNVLFTHTKEAVREELRSRHAAVAGLPRVLTLADVETVGERLEMLVAWARAAREIAGAG